MFLNIMTRIPGYPEDGMLTDVGGRGFPTLLVMDGAGKVLERRVPRTVGGMAAAMKGVEAPRPSRQKGVDAAADAMEFLRRVKMKDVRHGAAVRARYLSCRRFLKEAQREEVEAVLARLHLDAAQAALEAAEEPAARTRAELEVALARIKADTTPARRDEPGAAALATIAGRLSEHAPGTEEHDKALLEALAQRAKGGWPRDAAAAQALRALLDRAEADDDLHVFSILLGEWRAATGGKDEQDARHAARLQRLASGLPPLRRAVPR